MVIKRYVHCAAGVMLPILLIGLFAVGGYAGTLWGEFEDQPEDLIVIKILDAEHAPSPACLAAAPNGKLFVGIDGIGSLGKERGKGKIIRVSDDDNDGVVDHVTEFARVDNPRGLFAVGDKLYVLHTVFSDETLKAAGMDLVVFEDLDSDGIADGPPTTLIKNICSPKILAQRGADHATNGIRMGIDGWIYIAVGDFGFHEAEDRSGKKLSMMGGGIVRVRPDGTEMEIFTEGMRNIYDLAIDPLMNVFTRGNTNDGDGWNVRFTHHIQSGLYGYPSLFKRFSDEIVPPMADLGGGSGTGALYLDEDSWPAKYNGRPLTADWGRNHIFFHQVQPHSGTFKHLGEEKFLKVPQVTDLDVDGSGRMYVSAWDGAGFSGSDSKGFVLMVTPRSWRYRPFPDLEVLSVVQLADMLTSSSSVARLHASQELLQRAQSEVMAVTRALVSDTTLSLKSRVAALYTFFQAGGQESIPDVIEFLTYAELRPMVLNVLVDRLPWIEHLPDEPFINALRHGNVGEQIQAAIALGRLNRKYNANSLLQFPYSPTASHNQLVGSAGDTSGHHAVLPHLIVRSLVALGAHEACLGFLNTETYGIALWALKYMHHEAVPPALIETFQKTKNRELKVALLNVLARLYHREHPFDGTSWWGTRPDTRGPYYHPEVWQGSEAIKRFLIAEYNQGDVSVKSGLRRLNEFYNLAIEQFNEPAPMAGKRHSEPDKTDLNKIQSTHGELAKMAIEDVMVKIKDSKGDAQTGLLVYNKLGCNVCHSIRADEPPKGPFLGQIGSIMNREQIAESILTPNATIAQGFATYVVTDKSDKTFVGFIVSESSTAITMRDITGREFTVRKSEVKSRRQQDISMMPGGLANSLTVEEFASLLAYLENQK